MVVVVLVVVLVEIVVVVGVGDCCGSRQLCYILGLSGNFMVSGNLRSIWQIESWPALGRGRHTEIVSFPNYQSCNCPNCLHADQS